MLIDIGGEKIQGKIDSILNTSVGTKKLIDAALQADSYFKEKCLDKDLLDQALEIYPDKTKKEIVEIGLQELIRVSKRKELGQLFGSQKNLNLPRRAHRKNYHET